MKLTDRQKFEKMAGQIAFLLEFLHFNSGADFSPMVMHHLNELRKLAEESSRTSSDEMKYHMDVITKHYEEKK